MNFLAGKCLKIEIIHDRKLIDLNDRTKRNLKLTKLATLLNAVGALLALGLGLHDAAFLASVLSLVAIGFALKE